MLHGSATFKNKTILRFFVSRYLLSTLNNANVLNMYHNGIGKISRTCSQSSIFKLINDSETKKSVPWKMFRNQRKKLHKLGQISGIFSRDIENTVAYPTSISGGANILILCNRS